MNRPPAVSILFFLAPIVFVAGGKFYSDMADPQIARPAQAMEPEHQQRVRIAAMAARFGGAISYKTAFDPRYPGRSMANADAAEPMNNLFDPRDDYWGLPRTDGHEIVAGACAGCHSLEIIMQQHMTPDRWAYTLDWMVEKQGMAALPAAQRARVYDYLTRHFGSE